MRLILKKILKSHPPQKEPTQMQAQLLEFTPFFLWFETDPLHQKKPIKELLPSM